METYVRAWDSMAALMFSKVQCHLGQAAGLELVEKPGDPIGL